jgi:hypothetical protein
VLDRSFVDIGVIDWHRNGDMAGEDREREETKGVVSADATAGPVASSHRLPDGLVFRIAATATAAVLVVLVAAYGLYVVRNILVLVVVGLFVAISLEPVVRWLTGKGLRRGMAVTVVVFAAVACSVSSSGRWHRRWSARAGSSSPTCPDTSSGSRHSGSRSGRSLIGTTSRSG